MSEGKFDPAPRLCVRCGRAIESPRAKLYCSPVCGSKAAQERYGNALRYAVPPGTQGAIAELLVCAELMRRGYDVYRAMSPSCPCDLIAVLGGVACRVEVKSAQYTKAGTLITTPRERQRGAFDSLALVHRDGAISFVPEFREAAS